MFSLIHDIFLHVILYKTSNSRELIGNIKKKKMEFSPFLLPSLNPITALFIPNKYELHESLNFIC